MEKVKVAVLGHGHLGKWHTQKADQLANSELIAIVEPFNTEEVKKLYPNTKVVKTVEEVLNEIDAPLS